MKKQNKQWFWLGLVAVVLIFSGICYRAQAKKQLTEDKAEVATKLKAVKQEVQKMSDSEGFLTADLTQADLEQAAEHLEQLQKENRALKNQALNEQRFDMVADDLAVVSEKFELQEATNALFDPFLTAIKGQTTQVTAVITDETTREQIYAIESQLETNFPQRLAWKESLLTLTADAYTQILLQESADQAIKVLNEDAPSDRQQWLDLLSISVNNMKASDRKWAMQKQLLQMEALTGLTPTDI